MNKGKRETLEKAKITKKFGKLQQIPKARVLLITVENDAIWKNYVKTKINNTQKNSKCWERERERERVNHMINECRKQSYNRRYDRKVKVISGNCTGTNQNLLLKRDAQTYVILW